MKKIIISLSIIAVIAVISVGITTAYFSDTETSVDNTMAAGTMDLNIDDGDDLVTTMTLEDKAPGDTGKEVETLKNVGSLDGELDIAMGAVANHPCTDSGNGGKDDDTEYCNADLGSLGSNAEMALYIDIDKDGWNLGDIQLTSGGVIDENSGSETLLYDTIDSYNNVFWNDIYAGLMGLSTEDDFVIAWQIPTATGNGIQGDALDFDVTFTLEQAK